MTNKYLSLRRKLTFVVHFILGRASCW